MYNQGGDTPPPTDEAETESNQATNTSSGSADGVEEAEYTVVDDK